jgi:tetratricopeptide (TPR) repeat protein
MLALHYSGLAMGQASGNYQPNAQTLRQQLCIPANEHLLNKTHVERYMLLHGFYDNNLVLPQLDTVAVEQVFADIERFAKKHDDQDLVRELRYMRLVVQILHTDRMKRIRLLEHRFEEIKQSGKSWEVFLYSWLLGSQLLDTRGKADIGLYLLTDASETLHRGYRHPIERYLNYYIGTAYYSYNDLKGAKKYFGRALKEDERDTLFGTDIRVLNTLGLAYRKMNLLDSSDLYLNHALAISLEHGDTIMECIISGNLGENQYLRGNYDTAIVLLQKDANMALMHMDTGLASNALLLMADCYLSKGEFDKCWTLLQLGRDYAYRSKQYHRLKTLYPILAKWHVFNGDATLSTEYLDSARFVVDSLERIQMQVRIVPTDELYEMNRLQIESINQENRIKQRNMTLLAMLLALIIVLLLFQFYRIRSKLYEEQLVIENLNLQSQLQRYLKKIQTANATAIDFTDKVILTAAHWREFLNKFNRAHPQFLGAINIRYPTLTKSEIRFCCLTFLSMSDNEMADMLGVGVNSVRVTRNRVRKKLQLGEEDDLEVLLKGF